MQTFILLYKEYKGIRTLYLETLERQSSLSKATRLLLRGHFYCTKQSSYPVSPHLFSKPEWLCSYFRNIRHQPTKKRAFTKMPFTRITAVFVDCWLIISSPHAPCSCVSPTFCYRPSLVLDPSNAWFLVLTLAYSHGLRLFWPPIYNSGLLLWPPTHLAPVHDLGSFLTSGGWCLIFLGGCKTIFPQGGSSAATDTLSSNLPASCLH